MDRNDRGSAIGMSKKMVTAADSDEYEPRRFEGTDDLGTSQCREFLAHAGMLTR